MKTKSSLQNPADFFLNLPPNTKNVCFFHGEWGSVIAWDPIDVFQYKIGKKKSDFEKFIKKHSQKNKKIFGYISYDYGYELHKVKKTAKDDINLPDIYFLAYNKWQTFKNKSLKINLNPKKYQSENFTPTITQKDYEKAYKKIKKHIQAGDIYQINLTHRLEANTTIPARELFLRTLQKNPVSYAAYIEGDGFEIISASPEKFLSIHNGKMETCPIKGTRPRGKTRSEDQKLKNQLIQSEKEAAELNMITDLLRNDLGKVSKIGSVKVVGSRLISKCPTVWHTYSKIISELDQQRYSPFKALTSMLPGGSITGCPKKRAMEIIDATEKTTRSVYTGIIGMINPDQSMEFSIAIRTIIKKGPKLYLQVGGGIVLDSQGQDEFQETLHKAASFMKILC